MERVNLLIFELDRGIRKDLNMSILNLLSYSAIVLENR